MKIINLTGRTIILYAKDGETVLKTIEPSKDIPILNPANFYDECGQWEGIPLVNYFFKTGSLPNQKAETLYLVDEATLRSIPPSRKDFCTAIECVEIDGRTIGYKKICSFKYAEQ